VILEGQRDEPANFGSAIVPMPTFTEKLEGSASQAPRFSPSQVRAARPRCDPGRNSRSGRARPANTRSGATPIHCRLGHRAPALRSGVFTVALSFTSCCTCTRKSGRRTRTDRRRRLPAHYFGRTPAPLPRRLRAPPSASTSVVSSSASHLGGFEYRRVVEMSSARIGLERQLELRQAIGLPPRAARALSVPPAPRADCLSSVFGSSRKSPECDRIGFCARGGRC